MILDVENYGHNFFFLLVYSQILPTSLICLAKNVNPLLCIV